MSEAERTMQLYELVAILGGELLGPGDVPICQVAPLESAGPDQIAYLGRDAFRRALSTTRAGAVILSADHTLLTGRSRIIVSNPHAYFVRVAVLLNPARALRPGIHALAAVHPSARIAASAEIASFVSIGENAVIGEHVFVGPGCHVGAESEIGEASYLHANVVVYPRCIVGRRAVLNAGCVIGADGFGGALAEGRWLKMPHIGRVVLGDDVEVGANTTIDRGAMSDTVLEDGVKLDNQIQIGHNVRIGAHTTVAGCAGIAGSARIGAHCVIGGGAMIANYVTIVDRAQISAGTLIMHSITEAGQYTGIYPASEHRAWLRGAVQVRRLGESRGRRAASAAAQTKTDETSKR